MRMVSQSGFTVPSETIRLADDDIALHVPSKLCNKIWKGEYVNLAQLLRREPRKRASGQGSKVTINEKGTLTLLPKSTKQMSNIREWTDALLIYMYIVTKNSPDLSTWQTSERLKAGVVLMIGGKYMMKILGFDKRSLQCLGVKFTLISGLKVCVCPRPLPKKPLLAIAHSIEEKKQFWGERCSCGGKFLGLPIQVYEIAKVMYTSERLLACGRYTLSPCLQILYILFGGGLSTLSYCLYCVRVGWL